MNINYFMSEAIKEAKFAFDNDEVPVGGILVDNNTTKHTKQIVIKGIISERKNIKKWSLEKI